ncbi:LOW QUALITY PROTEIN: gamma-aminobutyric acid receptor subunit pi [Liasis olivaceus]
MHHSYYFSTHVWLFLLCQGKSILCQKVHRTDYPVTSSLPGFGNLTKEYNRYLRPNFGGKPVTIAMTLDVASISSISESDMDYTTTIYLRQCWTDPRLVFQGNQSFTLDAWLVKYLWVPDTYIVESKRSFLHEVTVENRLILFSNGTVLYALQISTTVACNMDLSKYPLDTQTCKLQMESWGSDENDVRFMWLRGNDSVHGLENLQLSQYTVEHFYTLVTRSHQETGVTTVLSMTTLMMGSRKSITNANGFIKAIDIYLGICFSFIFGALVEYGVAHYITSQKRAANETQKVKQRYHCSVRLYSEQSFAKDATRETITNILNTSVTASFNQKVNFASVDNASCSSLTLSPKDKIQYILKNKVQRLISYFTIQNPSKIDHYSKWLFPFFFILVNLFYWSYYLIF